MSLLYFPNKISSDSAKEWEDNMTSTINKILGYPTAGKPYADLSTIARDGELYFENEHPIKKCFKSIGDDFTLIIQKTPERHHNTYQIRVNVKDRERPLTIYTELEITKRKKQRTITKRWIAFGGERPIINYDPLNVDKNLEAPTTIKINYGQSNNFFKDFFQ